MKPSLQVALLALIAATADLAFGQGPLTPPGAPAPTFKTLQQVEPRTPISSAFFSITNPGSYYLTTNLTTATGNVINISTNDVILDLNGFTIKAGTSGRGIAVNNPQRNICVRNGVIRDCPSDGIGAANVNGGQFLDLNVSGNGASGLTIGNNCLIQNCVVISNAADGIVSGTGCRIQNCITASNVLAGIRTGSHCSVSDCTAANNSGHGINASFNNFITGCIAHQNGINGINATSSVVRLCRVNVNGTNGIFAAQQCVVTENYCTQNGFSTGGAGIRTLFGQNRIEANHLVGNGIGIFIDPSAPTSLIIRNSANGNGTGGTNNYSLGISNTQGPTNTTTGLITTNNPWLNFNL